MRNKVGKVALLRKRSSLTDAHTNSNLIVKELHKTITISMIDFSMFLYTIYSYTKPNKLIYISSELISVLNLIKMSIKMFSIISFCLFGSPCIFGSPSFTCHRCD
jgi:hypothetical protein